MMLTLNDMFKIILYLTQNVNLDKKKKFLWMHGHLMPPNRNQTRRILHWRDFVYYDKIRMETKIGTQERKIIGGRRRGGGGGGGVQVGKINSE